MSNLFTSAQPSECLTQTEGIKRFLQAGRRITPLEALHRFNCLRLGARIWDLRNEHGMDIKKNIKKVGRKYVAEYYI